MYNSNEKVKRKWILLDNEEIKAVHETDVPALLEALGELGNIEAGNLRCIYCGTVITLENIEGIVPYGSEVTFSCNATSCKINLLKDMG